MSLPRRHQSHCPLLTMTNSTSPASEQACSLLFVFWHHWQLHTSLLACLFIFSVAAQDDSNYWTLAATPSLSSLLLVSHSRCLFTSLLEKSLVFITALFSYWLASLAARYPLPLRGPFPLSTVTTMYISL